MKHRIGARGARRARVRARRRTRSTRRRRPSAGFEYIFDGTATGSDASFDKWLSANGATAVTLDPELGAMNPNTSGFGMKWYPVRPLGDVVVKLEYMWPAGATPNGGVMVRFPEPRYTRHDGGGPGPEADGLQLRPLPGRGAVVLRPAGAGAVDDLRLARRRSAVPAAVPLRGLLLRPQRHQQRDQHRGHVPGAHRLQRQQPPALALGLLRARDPDQRGAPDPRQRRGQDRLDVRVREPQREAGAELRAPAAGRLAHDGDPDGRPAAHGAGRRQRDQPVRQLGAAGGVACRRPADRGAPVPARLLRAADARRDRPDLLPRDPRQGARPAGRPAQLQAAEGPRATAGR